MMRIEWRDKWINTLVDAGFSAHTTRDTFQAIYGPNGPDVTKNATHEARAMLGQLKPMEESPPSKERQ